MADRGLGGWFRKPSSETLYAALLRYAVCDHDLKMRIGFAFIRLCRATNPDYDVHRQFYAQMGAWAGLVGLGVVGDAARVLEAHVGNGVADDDADGMAASLLLIALTLLAAASGSPKSGEAFNVVSRQLNDVIQYPLAEIALVAEPELFSAA